MRVRAAWYVHAVAAGSSGPAASIALGGARAAAVEARRQHVCAASCNNTLNRQLKISMNIIFCACLSHVMALLPSEALKGKVWRRGGQTRSAFGLEAGDRCYSLHGADPISFLLFFHLY